MNERIAEIEQDPFATVLAFDPRGTVSRFLRLFRHGVGERLDVPV